jgi:hypothetical protein
MDKYTGGVTLTGKPEVSGEKAVVPVPLVHQDFFIDRLYKTHATHKTHTHNYM